MAPSETSSTLMLSPQRNVTFAVNYEVSQLDRYWQKNPPPARVERKPDSGVENVPEPTADGNPNRSNNTVTSTATRSSGVNIEKVTTTMDDPVRSPETTKTLTALSDEDMNSSGKENKKKVVIIKSPTQERQRRSTREQKKKEVPVERTRVRYDMELVPAVKRNRAFLDRFPLWSTPSDTRQDKIKRFHYRQQSIIREHQQKLQVVQKQPLEEKKQPIVKEPQVANNGWIVPGQPQSSSLIQDDDTSPELVDDEVLTPFEDDSSVIWVPKKRSEWEDSVLEMTAVCTSAAMRRHMATRGRIPSNKPFHPPLSKEYIRDRVDIDDPLQGYQIRHRTGGWLQGFILWTNF
ncbi:expressed unknown protein [Seminavis robusta]|uniref:Uncharacterized protein n=1 Tax=Seminavis robusta TaxID=568900 RepID=A0A9N8DN21_9STRA|nr:expressed unknown protein [Seminavis robusta]|eukprot:Sro174_g076680.1 n/a (348) ;mRNA; f:53877-54920